MMSFHLGMQVRDYSSRGWRRNRDAHVMKNDKGNDERERGWGKEEPLMWRGKEEPLMWRAKRKCMLLVPQSFLVVGFPHIFLDYQSYSSVSSQGYWTDQCVVPALWLLSILDLSPHFFSSIAELGNGQFYLSVSSTEEFTLFLMHLVSAFPGAFLHTHIVCRAIMHLAGELIQQYNVFQTKCTLFPPGQLNRNKSVQKHWSEAKHFASWKDV